MKRRFASTPLEIIDRVMITIISITQLLVSLALLLMIPFIFNYGGASASPNAFAGFILFSLYGIASTFVLASRRFSGRVAVLLWHAVFIGTVVWSSAHRTSGVGNSSQSAAGALLWLLYQAVVLYLLITAVWQWHEAHSAPAAAISLENQSRGPGQTTA